MNDFKKLKRAMVIMFQIEITEDEFLALQQLTDSCDFAKEVNEDASEISSKLPVNDENVYMAIASSGFLHSVADTYSRKKWFEMYGIDVRYDKNYELIWSTH